MSAETLRRAAALMRELAENAEPGVWKLWGMQVMADTSGTSNVDLATPVTNCHTPSTTDRLLHTGNAQHIASWHPAVALAVADWLDVVADDGTADYDLINSEGEALTVARAYLGGEPTCPVCDRPTPDGRWCRACIDEERRERDGE